MPVMMRGPIDMPVMMRGHIVCQLCVGKTSKETSDLLITFTRFFFARQLSSLFLFCYWFTTLAKYSKHAWSLLAANIA